MLRAMVQVLKMYRWSAGSNANSSEDAGVNDHLVHVWGQAKVLINLVNFVEESTMSCASISEY